MHTLRSSLISALAVVGATSGVAHANAFYLAEHDAEAVGRGFANAASDDEPSSIVYNPGGVAVGRGTAVSVGGSLVFANASFTPDGGNKFSTTTSPQVLPNAFITSRVHELVAVGIGFHAPFGSAIDWPEDAPTANVLEHISLRTYFISPVVGINLDKYVPGLSIGGGIDIVPSTVEITQAIYFGTDRGSAHLGGTATGIGGRAGIQYHPAALRQLELGVMWRSKVTENYTGNADFNSAPEYRSVLPPDGKISTSVTMPQSISGGVAYRPIKPLQVEADLSWVGWSSFNTLDITLPNGAHQVTQEQYKDTLTVRIGAEYRLPEQHLALRLGYIYDPTPIKPEFLTVQLPDANRNDITAGATYHVTPDYAVALGLLVVLPTSRQTATTANEPPNKGQFDISAFVASLSLRGRFGH